MNAFVLLYIMHGSKYERLIWYFHVKKAIRACYEQNSRNEQPIDISNGKSAMLVGCGYKDELKYR